MSMFYELNYKRGHDSCQGFPGAKVEKSLHHIVKIFMMITARSAEQSVIIFGN